MRARLATSLSVLVVAAAAAGRATAGELRAWPSRAGREETKATSVAERIARDLPALPESAPWLLVPAVGTFLVGTFGSRAAMQRGLKVAPLAWLLVLIVSALLLRERYQAAVWVGCGLGIAGIVLMRL